MQNLKNKSRKVFWVDLFCGAGGTSSGLHKVNKNVQVVYAVNHDKNAIRSHRKNHRRTIHATEDIRDFLVVQKIKKKVAWLRKNYPGCIINLWASLECTNFSRAKGGQARDADSRSLADYMPLYLIAGQFDSFYVENVREFLAWGPMYIPEIKLPASKENGAGGLACSVKIKYVKKREEWETVAPWRPISKDKGKDYLRWVESIKNLGYHYDYKILNSANYGAYQSRERLFIQFSKDKKLISWPEQTHTKDVNESEMFPMPKWKKVKDVLDLEDEGNSIFGRKKDLAEKTLNVIYNGILKALKEKENTILYKYYGNGDNLNSINTVAGTVTTKDRFAKLQIIFNQYATGNVSSIENPIGTQTTNPKANLLSFILNPSHGGHTTSINKASPTIIARQDKAPLYLIRVLMDQYGISDIKMRMLNIKELLRIQGFDENYQLVGTQTEKKKYIGNAVHVDIAEAFGKSNYERVLKTAA